MLSWTVYSSFIGALVCALWPRLSAEGCRRVALGSALIGLICATVSCLQYNIDTNAIQFVAKSAWIPSLGISYHTGADGISLTLVLLTGLTAVIGILFSWDIQHRPQEFFAFFLVLIGGVYGVFISFDLFLLFVFYEIVIIPKYFLIVIWGSTRKEYGAMKLVLYSFVGSALVLIGLLATYVEAGAVTFDLIQLIEHPYSQNFQYWAFPVTFVGFAVLAGLWPFHTWAPTGHVAAPTGASMLLAGVVMKLGAYGALRFPMTLFPMGLETWRDELALLAVVGIVYGATSALVQRDFKFVIGYSSVSHMGFVLLGLMATSEVGLSGAVLQMFSHGILASLLFGVVGRMVYARTHTRDLSELETLQLAKRLPFAAGTFVVAGFAGMGMPGFSGFVAELQVLIGAWNSFPTFAVLAGVGIIIGVSYTLRVMIKAFFTEEKPFAKSPKTPLSPLTIQEKVGAGILIATTTVIGLYPRLLLDLIVPSLSSPMLEPLIAK
ncbi:MAG: NADH-quinone oxidoreductase subunit M [Verrucomicrobia subdivision 3 bacterium]|nr:NADH-quinone oxidoreductase subunit M [Limisphaerales bacterium]MCS1414445.1 NADH-quinone oxidoreductase subunit M [Limisphaerales bacterium]